MTIRFTSGLERLVVGVRDFFSAHGVTAVVAFGRKELAKQSNQGPGGANRVVIAPVDPKSGAGGRLVHPSQGGRRDVYQTDPEPADVRVGTTRALWDWEREMVVSVWAYDSTRPEDELAQETALQFLLEKTIQAVHDVAKASAEWGGIGFVVPKGERTFGLEARIALRFTHPLFDVPDEVGHPGFTLGRHEQDDEG